MKVRDLELHDVITGYIVLGGGKVRSRVPSTPSDQHLGKVF